MALAVGDVHRVRVFIQHLEQIAVNTYHYRVLAVNQPVISDQGIADAYSNLFNLMYIPLIPIAGRYLGLQFSHVLPTRSIVTTSASGAGPGTKAGEILPRQVSAVLSMYDGTPTRGGRGRIYWPFPVEADNAAGAVLENAYKNSLQAIANTILNVTLVDNVPQPIGTVNLAIYHKGPPATSTLVVSMIAQAIWGSQRRRGSYGRPNVAPRGL